MTGGGVRLVLRLAVATVLLVLAFRLALPDRQENIAESLAAAWTSAVMLVASNAANNGIIRKLMSGTSLEDHAPRKT